MEMGHVIASRTSTFAAPLPKFHHTTLFIKKIMSTDPPPPPPSFPPLSPKRSVWCAWRVCLWQVPRMNTSACPRDLLLTLGNEV